MYYLMKTIVITLFVAFTMLFLLNCSNNTSKITEESALVSLSEKQAEHIFSLPVHCLNIEYPNKLGQVLGSDKDLKSPKQLRPIFYGCFDWHSSVHGYWSIINLMKKYPGIDEDGKVRQLLNAHITVQNAAVELAFFEDINNTTFERTYGWAWLFKLHEALATWDDQDAKRWKTTLQPLVDHLVAAYKVYLPKLIYPIRAGQHDNSAFGLSLSLDYARAVGDKEFEDSIVQHAKRLFLTDENCNLVYEPSGYDFLSPCFEEAYLMAKIMDKQEYTAWLKRFLPPLFDESFTLTPAVVKDRTDGKLVHLDGLNYSRAACLYGITKILPELNHLNSVANAHIAFSLPNLSTQDDYMGSHWLGTFALYALEHVH